jgi:tetratricopeptide (TPR) repeat protein
MSLCEGEEKCGFNCGRSVKMIKKTFLILLFLAGIAFCEVTKEQSADVEALIKQVRMYVKWYPGLAKKICKTIIAKYPGTDYALEAQRRLANSYLWTRENTQMQEELNRLIADYAGNPKLPAEMYRLAWECEEFERVYGPGGDYEGFGGVAGEGYSAAKNIYQLIVRKYPDSNEAGKARLDVSRVTVLSFIRTGRSSNAPAAIDRMLDDFSEHPDLAAALYDTAVEYEKAGKYEQAKELYQGIMKSFPDTNETDYAMSSQKHLAFLSLAAGKDKEAKEALDKLMGDFAKHPRLTETLYDTAKEYEKRGRYDEAGEIYRQTSQTSAHPFRSDKAKVDAAKVKIMGLVAAGDDGNAAPAIDKLAADFSGHPYLAAAVSQIAKQYSEKARRLEKDGFAEQAKSCFQKAAGIYETVTNKLGDSITYSQTSGRIREYETGTPKAFFELACCYRRMGEYDKSTLCYKMLMDKYPEFIRTRDAFFMVEQNYLDMSKAGLLSQASAESKIRAVYEEFLKKYPDCTTMDYARSWLSKHKVEK